MKPVLCVAPLLFVLVALAAVRGRQSLAARGQPAEVRPSAQLFDRLADSPANSVAAVDMESVE